MMDTWRTSRCRYPGNDGRLEGRWIPPLGSCWDVDRTCPTWNSTSFWPERRVLHRTRSCRTPVGYPRAPHIRGCSADVWSRRRLPIRANHWLLDWFSTRSWRSLGRGVTWDEWKNQWRESHVWNNQWRWSHVNPQKTIKGVGVSPSPSKFPHHPLRSTWYKTLSMWSGALLSALVRFQDDRREEKRGFRRSDQFFKCAWRRDLEWGGERGKNATGENGGRRWEGKKIPPHGVNGNETETAGAKEKVPRETPWDFSGAKKKVPQKTPWGHTWPKQKIQAKESGEIDRD